jgi:hypothetical protein
MRIAIVSNDDWAVRASLADERRFFVLKCGEGNQQDHKFFGKIDAQMKRGGYEAMLFDLLRRVPKNGWESLRKPPATAHLRSQQLHTLSGMEKFFYQLLKEGSYEFSDGSEPITLRDEAATNIPTIELRAAIQDYLENDHPNEKARAKVENITRMAREWCGARSIKRSVPGRTNAATVLEFPPRCEAQRWAEAHLKLDFNDEALAAETLPDNILRFPRAELQSA